MIRDGNDFLTNRQPVDVRDTKETKRMPSSSIIICAFVIEAKRQSSSPSPSLHRRHLVNTIVNTKSDYIPTTRLISHHAFRLWSFVQEPHGLVVRQASRHGRTRRHALHGGVVVVVFAKQQQRQPQGDGGSVRQEQSSQGGGRRTTCRHPHGRRRSDRTDGRRLRLVALKKREEAAVRPLDARRYKKNKNEKKNNGHTHANDGRTILIICLICIFMHSTTWEKHEKKQWENVWGWVFVGLLWYCVGRLLLVCLSLLDEKKQEDSSCIAELLL